MGSDLASSVPMWLLLTTAGICIILSMIFSATESAFLSINKLRVRFLKNKKNKRATRVWNLLSDKERLINTLLVGNNIVNVIISSIIAYLALQWFGNAGIGIATFSATMLLLIFGEITPKTIATHHPEAIAFFFSGFIFVVEKILTPFVFIFTKISQGILRLFKINTKEKNISFTEEEIKTFIEVSGEQGVIDRNKKNKTELVAVSDMCTRRSLNFRSVI